MLEKGLDHDCFGSLSFILSKIKASRGRVIYTDVYFYNLGAYNCCRLNQIGKEIISASLCTAAVVLIKKQKVDRKISLDHLLAIVNVPSISYQLINMADRISSWISYTLKLLAHFILSPMLHVSS